MYLLGSKLGMTRLFKEDGTAVPVTAIEVQQSTLVQHRTEDRDGYVAIQVGGGEARHPKKPQVGHAKDLPSVPKTLREFRVDGAAFERGHVFTAADLQVGDVLTMTGTSKGKGFAGVIKRHNFHRGPETHGSDHHRAPGSIGSMFPQHVLKGKKMPGKMGNDRVTRHGIQVEAVYAEQNIIFVRGAVPGSRGALVQISRA
jgi:large subunit ribosomal protein L3